VSMWQQEHGQAPLALLGPPRRAAAPPYCSSQGV